MSKMYTGLALVVAGLLLLLRSFGLFESLEKDVLYAGALIVIGSLLVMQGQK